MLEDASESQDRHAIEMRREERLWIGWQACKQASP